MKCDQIQRTVKYRPAWENSKLDYGIGIIGAGCVVEWGHLPTYCFAGMNVAAIADRAELVRERARKRWQVKRVFADFRNLLELSEVDIVDIGIHHKDSKLKLEIVRAAAKAQKHILIHKPIANNFKTALEMVEVAKKYGVKLAVNQNFRWNPPIYAAKQIIDAGYIGKLQTISIENIAPASWVSNRLDQPCYDLLAWSIHSFDLYRYWINSEPKARYAKTFNHQHLVTAEFDHNIQVTLYESSAYGGGADDHKYSFRITGTEGVIKGHLGCHSYYRMEPDQLVFFSKHFPEGLRWQTISLPANPVSRGNNVTVPSYDLHSPYAGFLGSIGSLMEAITNKEEPPVSGRDNLKTLQFALAPYKSTLTGKEFRFKKE